MGLMTDPIWGAERQIKVYEMKKALERLASLEHFQWSSEVHARRTRSPGGVEYWKKLADMRYEDLDEEAKELDRPWARMVLLILADARILDKSVVDDVVGEDASATWDGMRQMLSGITREELRAAISS